MKVLTALFMGLSLSVMTCGSVWAQATAQMTGTVSDPTGALLPGVEVTATQTATGVSRVTLTNETASYVLPTLPLGPYQLEASLPGFQTFVQTGIVLQVDSNPVINIVLEVGQVTQTIEVTATTALVETRNLAVGQVVNTERIVALPLNGRNVQELLVLGGGAVQAGGPGGMTFSNDRLMISTAGGLMTTTETRLDGIRHVDPFDGVSIPLPFPDALGEFKTEIGGQEAKRGLGAQISAVTASGTNEFHGTLFAFHRNDLFNARHYFAKSGPTLKRNQFGGVVGGPIMENKLFFFGGVQGTTLRADPRNVRQIIPTPEMLAGDFRAHASKACNPKALTLKGGFGENGFAPNMIDPALFNPIALAVVARMPKPEDTECGEITFGTRTTEDQLQLVNRIDYQSTDAHSLFARFLFTRYTRPPTVDPNNIFTAGSSTDARSYAFTTGSTYLVNPNTVNALRLSFSRHATRSEHLEVFSMSELGSKVYDGYSPGNTNISVTSGFTLRFGSDSKYGTMLYQLADDLSMLRGTHQFGFGGRVAHSRAIMDHGSGRPPNFRFTGRYTGRGLGDFLLGSPSRLNQVTGHYIFARVNYLSLYAQDTWQVTPRLTLSAGFRWEPIFPQKDTWRPVPYVMNFDEDKYVQGVTSQVFLNAPPGLFFAGDSEFEQNWNENLDKPIGSLWNTFWAGWAPRAGLAWDVQGDGRTSVRASYGLSYVNYPANTRLGTQSSMPPHGGYASITDPVGGLSDPWLGFPGGNPHPINVAFDMPFPAFAEVMPEKAELIPTYTQTWNVSLQREVTTGTLLSASYVGTSMIHTQATQSLNQSIFVDGLGDASGNCFLNGAITHFTVVPGDPCSTVFNTQTRRRLTFLRPDFEEAYGRLALRENGGTQNYHGMIVSLEQRATQGINFNVNYTWAHCIGDYLGRSNSGFGSSADHAYLDPDNRRHDRGNCEMDQRHAFNLLGVFSMPEFANRTLSLLAGGWRLSPIFRRNTAGNAVRSNQSSGLKTVTLGRPSQARAAAEPGVDRCLCDASNQRPDQVLGSLYLDKSGDPGTQYMNPDAFALPKLGTLGTLNRATVKLPTFWQFDLSLARIIQFREAQSVELRVEAYNVLNSFRPAAIDMNLSSSRFGIIRTALDPRILQFALKYSF